MVLRAVAATLRAVAALGILSPLVAARLLLLVVLRVGVDDATDQRVAHHVFAREAGEEDVVDLVEHLGDEPQAAGAGRQVDLGDVAGDDHARAEAEPGEEHLHLLGRRVLRLVEHDERVVERAAAHVGERGDLDRAGRQQLGHELGIHHLVERVVQRAQVRVDLVGQRAGQEAEPLPRLDRRAGSG